MTRADYLLLQFARFGVPWAILGMFVGFVLGAVVESSVMRARYERIMVERECAP